jgi:tetratricopeptide (TPR) repeat protein
MTNDSALVSSLHRLNQLEAATDRLESWKEIAYYLRREVRTVQLWEKNEGLPVHRHFHKQLGSVFAFRSEIEEWARRASRTNVIPQKPAAEPTVSSKISFYRVVVRVLPLEDIGIASAYKRLPKVILAKTIAALEQLNPGRLQILSPQVPSPQVPSPQLQGQKLTASSAARISKSEHPNGQSDGYVLRWSLRQEKFNSFEITADLLCSGDVIVSWSNRFEPSSGNHDQIAEYVADQIVQCLWLKVISSPAPSPLKRMREKPDSRAVYARGRYFWNQRNKEGLRKAVHCFESAIQADPEFALPYSGLADSLTLLSFYEIVPPSEAMPSARRAALKAIELDPTLAEAHASLGDVLLHFDRDWHGADREYRCAIQCNPEYALGYHWYANLLAAKGNHEAAHIAIMRALDIDPVSLITVVWAGVTAHLAHRFDEAIQHYKSALELDPRFIWAHMYMAQGLEQKGDFDGALREFETAIQLAGGSNCVKAMMAHAHAVAGDRSSARQILRELKTAPGDRCMPSYDIAATYAALGDSNQMVVWLNRACEEHNMKLFTLNQDPRFDPLRHCSEFKQIVEQMGLARYGHWT